MSQTTSAEAAQAAPPDDFNAYEEWRAGQEKEQEVPSGGSAKEPVEDPPVVKSEGAGEVVGDDEPEAENAGDTDKPEEEEHEKPKRKGGYRRRIDRLTREKQDLEAKLAEYEAKPKPEAAPAEKPKPNVEDFDSYEEFTEALTDWKLEQRAKADADRNAQQSREQEARQAEQKRLEGWNTRATQVREQHPDYDDTLASVDDIENPPYLQEALLDSEVGPALAYKLAQDPDALERIVALPATSAIRELGRLEASLEAPASKPKPTATATPAVTRAPKPVTPLRPKGAATNIHDLALAEDYNAWEKVRERQLRG